MKNKREIIIAVASLVLGIVLTYLILQSSTIDLARQIISQSSKTQNTESKSLNPVGTTLSAEQFTAQYGNKDDPSLKTAIESIEQKGYTVIDDSKTWYISSQPLNALIGACAGAEGYCKKTFFFYNEEYIGTDTSDPSSQISIVWRNSDTIALNYILYRKDDPMCCPTAGAATVRFKWDGNKLVALDPIPPLGLSADVHR